MDTSFKQLFIKDVRKLPLQTRKRIERFALENAAEAKGIGDIGKIVKISGYANYYRKRFGDYRVGFKIDEDRITFFRALHRKEIYRYFP